MLGAQERNKQLVICFHCDSLTQNVRTEFFKCPCDGQCLFLYLGVTSFGVRHGTGGVGNWIPPDSSFWSRTAPRPKDEASAKTFSSLALS